MTLGRELVTNTLLRRQVLVGLKTSGLRGEVLGLPRRRADVARAVRVFEHLVDFLERLSGRLREEEEDMDRHSCAEDTEDDVCLPGDVDEGWRDKVAEGEAGGSLVFCKFWITRRPMCLLESPISGGAECHCFATQVVRIELWWVDPRDYSRISDAMRLERAFANIPGPQVGA